LWFGGEVVEKAGMQAVMINHRGHGNAPPEKEKIIGR
jgi:alpha-beta hydrolase superfamily lysophospholipase